MPLKRGREQLQPHTDSGRASRQLIINYRGETRGWTPPEIRSLSNASVGGSNDVVFWPKETDPSNSNNNSTIKLFRRGYFNVLSLGDVEDASIATRILGPILRSDVDVMILAHHGAANGFTSAPFLDAVNPTVAICSSNYDNQYEHPRQEIRDLLYQKEIRLYTTKTGNVLIEGNSSGVYAAINFGTNNVRVSSTASFRAK